MNISTVSILSMLISVTSIVISIAAIASIRRDEKLLRDMEEQFAVTDSEFKALEADLTVAVLGNILGSEEGM